MFTQLDHLYMTRALQLAEQGLYSTSPNPRVGCVITLNDEIVGEGAHLTAGEPHAEVFALRQAGTLAKGATAYVTLEPCSHHGRTPPCADALVQAGIAKVVVAMVDPNPLVAGKGLMYLQSHGIATLSGLMSAQAHALNPGFISRMTQLRPFVRCKIATSLDGKTALENNQSQWITSAASRSDVQHWRARSCAIMTGIGTVLADNPTLNVRDIATTRQPLRVVVDSQLQTPPDANIVKHGGTLIAYAHDTHHKAAALMAAGATLLNIPNADGQVCLHTLLAHLAREQINELMVEAGQGLNGALVALGLVDELLLYMAPKLMGGHAKSMLDLPSLTKMQQALDVNIIDMRAVGQDIRLRAQLVKTDT